MWNEGQKGCAPAGNRDRERACRRDRACELGTKRKRSTPSDLLRRYEPAAGGYRLTQLAPVVALVVLIMSAIMSAPLSADDWADLDDDWGDNDGIDMSGYLESTGIALLPRDFDGEPNFGLQSILRLRGRFEPASSLSVTVEAEYRDRRAAANPLTRQSLIGASSLDESGQAQFVGTDFNREFVFDYAYASARFGALDIRVGRQPLAWGSAYAFNPTERMNPASLAELTGIEPPGITAIAPSLSLGSGLGIEGYVAFEDRSRRATALTALSEAHNIPFGLRARAYLGLWDFAAGFLRSVDAGGATAGAEGQLTVADYAVAEIAGPLGPVTVYGEAAVEVDPDASWRLERSVDGAVGFQYELPFEVGLQAEYHRRGRGAADSEDYDPQERIAGQLVARDYLVGVVDRYFFDDEVHATLAALTNLNDSSTMLIPELQYSPLPDLELGLGASVLLGPEDSEFDGRFERPTGNGETASIDLGRPQLFLSAKWYF